MSELLQKRRWEHSTTDSTFGLERQSAGGGGVLVGGQQKKPHRAAALAGSGAGTEKRPSLHHNNRVREKVANLCSLFPLFLREAMIAMTAEPATLALVRRHPAGGFDGRQTQCLQNLQQSRSATRQIPPYTNSGSDGSFPLFSRLDMEWTPFSAASVPTFGGKTRPIFPLLTSIGWGNCSHPHGEVKSGLLQPGSGHDAAHHRFGAGEFGGTYLGGVVTNP